MSDGRNKGRKKKMDEALRKYEEIIRDALNDERLDAPEEEAGEGPGSEYAGRECPDCGKFIASGPGGILECGCGFRGRIVTPAIEELPEDIGELRGMAREALKGNDSELLNNLGERILDRDADEWLGNLAIGKSCVLDGNLSVAAVMISEGSSTLGKKGGADEFCDIAEEILAEGMANASAEDDLLSLIYLPSLIWNAENISDRRFLEELIDRIMETGGMGNEVSIAVCALSMPRLMTFSMSGNPYLQAWESLCGKAMAIMGMAETRLKDPEVCPQTKSQDMAELKRNMEFVSYLAGGISSRISGSSPEEMEALRKGWKGSEKLLDLMDEIDAAVRWDESENPGPKEMAKAKRTADRVLDAYMAGAVSQP